VLSSLTLLAAYVWHSHVTPNTPPPDPFGLNTIELELKPEVVEFEGFIDYGNLRPRNDQTGSEIRIISSKVINQPIFSVHKFTWAFVPGPEERDPFVPLPRPYAQPKEERVGTWFPGFEMTGMSIDPLRKPSKP
jgi:hypothetical protein